jgi:hypothetical protein
LRIPGPCRVAPTWSAAHLTLTTSKQGYTRQTKPIPSTEAATDVRRSSTSLTTSSTLITCRLLVLTSERRVRPPSPTLSLRVPEVQPSAGEAAIADLLRLFSQAQQHARANHAPRQPLARGLTVRAATPSFLSAGIPRDRRGRIGGHDVKRMILSAGGWPVSVPAARRRSTLADDVDADAEDEGENEGGETPRLGMMDSRERREVLSSLRVPLEHHHRASTGGWGLGAGNEEKQREDDDDDDEAPNWDSQVRFEMQYCVVFGS